MAPDVDATSDDAVRRARQLLAEGRIVAVKGLGGYHLACDARNDGAVAELRRRKRRGGKPLAVMVRDIDVAEELVAMTGDERRLLTGTRRPIVLLPRVVDQPAKFTTQSGESPNVRRLLVDLHDEYARHVGHADLLREAVDGLVGEDPPQP
ncbi:MAG: Sua5/YciO/YrdC/YwlC family protein [Nocardioides sp.]